MGGGVLVSLVLLILVLLVPALVHGRGFMQTAILRTVWVHVGLFWLVGIASGNGWLMGMLGVLGFNLLRDPQAGQKSGGAGMSLALVAGALVVASHGTASWVLPLVQSVAGLGVVLGLWACVSLYYHPQCYRLLWGPLGFSEERENAIRIEVGQGNQNHTQALAAVCIAASCGLAWTQSWWWLVAAGFGLIVMLAVDWATRHKRWGVTQGHVYLWHLALLGVAGWVGWWSLLILVPYLGACGWAFWRYHGERRGPDTGRFRRWYILLGAGVVRSVPNLSFAQAWLIRLFGQGWRTWIVWAEKLCEADQKRFPDKKAEIGFMTSAHNEFVQMWFEHGFIGLVTLVGFCGWAFWHVWEAQAIVLLPLMVTVISIACLSMPWSLYHEVTGVDEKSGLQHTSGVGFPALNAVSLVLAILVLGL